MDNLVNYLALPRSKAFLVPSISNSDVDRGRLVRYWISIPRRYVVVYIRDAVLQTRGQLLFSQCKSNYHAGICTSIGVVCPQLVRLLILLCFLDFF